MEKHKELTERFSTWGHKLLQHPDVLLSIREGKFKPITIQLAPTETCFSGDTKVRLLNGTERTLKELTDSGETDFWVYSYDVANKKVVPGKALRSRLTRENQALLKVTLDNGYEIKCTPDHQFLLLSGAYKEAQHLTTADSLMPLYLRHSTVKDDNQSIGYEMLLDVTQNKWKFTHRTVTDNISIISINHKGEEETKSVKHTVRHHRDFNKLNNSPDNLAWMQFIEHRKLHHAQSALLFKDGNHPWQKYTKTEKHRKRSSDFFKTTLPKMYVDGIIPRPTPPNNPEYRAKGQRVLEELKRQGKHPVTLRVKNGTHHFQDKNFQKKVVERNKALSKAGKHPFQQDWVRKETSERLKKRTAELFKNNKHHFQKKEFIEQLGVRQNTLVLAGKHPFQTEENRKKSSDRMKVLQKYQAFIRMTELTKEIYPFAKFKIDRPDLNGIINHKVISIEEIDSENVYCLEVEKYHNFALSVGVFVSNCDEGCTFCSVSERPLKSVMSFDKIRKCLEDFKQLGAKSLEITGGGNPMLYKDGHSDINSIITLAWSLDYKVGIITNSISLKKLDPEFYPYINWIRVSLISIDTKCEPEDYDFNGFPYEKLGFSYIIYEAGQATGAFKKRFDKGTTKESIERIARLVELHPQIKFVRIAGNCLVKGNNKKVADEYKEIIDAVDKHGKFFIKTIYDNDSPYDNHCSVGMIRPYIAPSPEGGDYQVYTCTSHVLQKRTYDLEYSLCSVDDILPTWAAMNENFKTQGFPYEVKGNKGKNWCGTCKFCYYANNNEILHAVSVKSADHNFA